MSQFEMYKSKNAMLILQITELNKMKIGSLCKTKDTPLTWGPESPLSPLSPVAPGPPY